MYEDRTKTIELWRHNAPRSIFNSSLTCLWLLWLKLRFRSNRSRLIPPGPPADPIIGHVRLIPANRPELTYATWGKEYSTLPYSVKRVNLLIFSFTDTDVLYLNILGQPVVILNSAEASITLLEKRSANYSGRPRVHSLEEYIKIQPWEANDTNSRGRQGWSNQLSIGIISTGVQMRKHRKMLQNALTPHNCLVYRDAQQEEARKLVRRIIETPDKWIRHMQTLVHPSRPILDEIDIVMIC
jgi:hypothetical protein